MELSSVYQSYLEKANLINWKKFNQNELFREYISHENDPSAENYFAGIVCRYWGYAGRIYRQCNKHVPFDVCYDILIDAITYVIKHRVWENPESSLYGDPAGPDKAIHIALVRQRGITLSKLTAEKRQANFNTLSIDEMYENYNDSTEGLFNIVENAASTKPSDSDWEMIEYIKSKPVKQRLILDAICFTNWKSMNAIVKKIKKLSDKDFLYFNKVYDISKPDYVKAVNDYYLLGKTRILFDIKKTLHDSLDLVK